MRYKNLPIEIKSLKKNGLITGYASVFNIIDSHKDKFIFGSFKKTIQNQYKQNIKFLWQHRIDEPIAVISHIEEDRYGLYVEAKLVLALPRAIEALSLISLGTMKGLSIGYIPHQCYYEEKRDIRVITEVELIEISLVTFPANNKATLVKS